MRARLGAINGVVVKPLKRIVDDRGWLLEILRSDWQEFDRFGQTYITTCLPGVVKGWHYHKIQWDHFVPVRGNALIALFDARKESETSRIIQEIEVKEDQPKLIKIPPFVYHGFTPLDEREIWVVNTPTELYNYTNPDEYRLDWNDSSIGYSWRRKV